MSQTTYKIGGLLLLDVHLGLEEEGVQCRRGFYANRFGKVAAQTEATLEQVILHIIDHGDFHDFLVEPLNVCSEGFLFFLNYNLKRGFNLGAAARGGEVS